jgi:hypothetical protein
MVARSRARVLAAGVEARGVLKTGVAEPEELGLPVHPLDESV